MTKNMKRVLAVVLVLAIIGSLAAGYTYLRGYETGEATLTDLINSRSQRGAARTTIVSDDSPYLAMIGTPVALYYDNPPGMDRVAAPLLVVSGQQEQSRAVIRFLDQYEPDSVMTIGDVPTPLSSSEREWESPTTATLNVERSFTGTPKKLSLNVAKSVWQKSDGVLLVKNDQAGYNHAVVALPLASYLNIPVIVTDTVDGEVAGVLDGLGVKYSVLCGDFGPGGGYKLAKRFKSTEEIQDWTTSIIRLRLHGEVRYITMANPLDITERKVSASEVVIDVTDVIEHSPSTAYPGRPELGEGPLHAFDVPYRYTNIKIDLKLDITGEGFGDDAGARIYGFLGIDGNQDGFLDEGTEEDHIKFFGGSPGYSNIGLDGDFTGNLGTSADALPASQYAYFHTEVPIFNDVREHCIQLLAKMPTDDGRFGGNWDAEYTLTVTVEKLESPIYPRLQSASSLAGYLTAYRSGVVLAEPKFTIYSASYVRIKDSSNPASNLELIEPTNRRVAVVKAELNDLLGRLAIPQMPTGTDDELNALADYYHELNQREDYTHLGILADPQMVPHYYYPSEGLGEDSLEGYKVPSDNIYADIDADLELPVWGLNQRYPRMELADGRLSGFDVQDISALLGRTFFYSDILDKMLVRSETTVGGLGGDWKSNGFGTIGTEPPVGPAKTAEEKLEAMWGAAEFTTDNGVITRQYAGKQEAGPYYESANFLFMCAHGFYYWYVPTASRSFTPYFEIGGGGAFDVAHVKLMNFGPTVFWTSSCVTGRIDGLEQYNCLANAFLHGGMNCYLGGTRSMWGVILPQPDESSGEKLGDLMVLYWYGHMCGYVWDHSEGDGAVVELESHYDTSTGVALMLAKNEFIEDQGTDGAGVNDDTYEEVLLHGDPAFNPYEPNHEGRR